jgi:hypothetical protein
MTDLTFIACGKSPTINGKYQPYDLKLRTFNSRHSYLKNFCSDRLNMTRTTAKYSQLSNELSISDSTVLQSKYHCYQRLKSLDKRINKVFERAVTSQDTSIYTYMYLHLHRDTGKKLPPLINALPHLQVFHKCQISMRKLHTLKMENFEEISYWRM